MKKSKINLKEWRLKVSNIGLNDNIMSLCLEIYDIIIQAIERLHNNKIIHYDIKCDNVLIDYDTEESIDELIESGKIFKIIPNVHITDFGECRMFLDDEDEFSIRPRGTDYIKSPEMLMLSRAKNLDNFDRRKKYGTTRKSDIWSLGCLFYEILTGEFLFYDDN